VGNKSVFYKRWIAKGIHAIKHLIDDNKIWLSYADFTQRFNIETDFITYIGLISSVKKYVEHSRVEVNCLDNTVGTSKTLQVIFSITRGAKIYYDILQNNDTSPNKPCTKWEIKMIDVIDWKQVFRKLHYMKDITLRWLQFRIIYRILGTNIVLKNMQIEPSDQCTFCGLEKETIEHLFWKCIYTNNFWGSLQNLIRLHCSHASNFSLNENLVLFGYSRNFKSDNVFDLILMIGKQYIYKCKLDKKIPYLHVFLNVLKERYIIEKLISFKNMTQHTFYNQWCLYANLFT
jgi:hypothetical protein